MSTSDVAACLLLLLMGIMLVVCCYEPFLRDKVPPPPPEGNHPDCPGQALLKLGQCRFRNLQSHVTLLNSDLYRHAA